MIHKAVIRHSFIMYIFETLCTIQHNICIPQKCAIVYIVETPYVLNQGFVFQCLQLFISSGIEMEIRSKIFTVMTIIVLSMFCYLVFGFSKHVRHSVFDISSVLNLKDDETMASVVLIPALNWTYSSLLKPNKTVVNISEKNSNYTTDVQCPDVLKYMTYGKWKSRKVSRDDEKEMEVFLLKSRNQYGIPASFQRQDGKCGNVPFEDIKLKWFRPLCDPKGPTPCCYNNECRNSSIEDCRCKDCYDMRTSINAEHADWIPSHKQCQVPSRTADQLCQYVDKRTINFIGDSFIRHIYLAFILLLKDNLIDGAMISSTPKEKHDECSGYYMFTEKQCRSLLVTSPIVCQSRVNIHYYQQQSSDMGLQIQRLILRSNDPKTYFIVGTGVHDDFNTTKIWNRILLPVLQNWKRLSVKPTRLLWHAAHAPGLLKTPFVPMQGYDRAFEFNKEMKGLLQQYGVPIFESFNFTAGVNSFDGSHFGQGVNLIKARIIFEYFRELKENGTV